jgi:hypothetical protein
MMDPRGIPRQAFQPQPSGEPTRFNTCTCTHKSNVMAVAMKKRQGLFLAIFCHPIIAYHVEPHPRRQRVHKRSSHVSDLVRTSRWGVD